MICSICNASTAKKILGQIQCENCGCVRQIAVQSEILKQTDEVLSNLATLTFTELLEQTVEAIYSKTKHSIGVILQRVRIFADKYPVEHLQKFDIIKLSVVIWEFVHETITTEGDITIFNSVFALIRDEEQFRYLRLEVGRIGYIDIRSSCPWIKSEAKKCFEHIENVVRINVTFYNNFKTMKLWPLYVEDEVAQYLKEKENCNE